MILIAKEGNMKFLYLMILILGVSCSSTKERTLSSMDDKPRPSWASQEKAFQLKDGKLRILGFTEVDGNAKVSAAFRLSDNSARAELSKMLQTQFQDFFQNVEEGLDDSGSLTRYYSSEISKNKFSELQIPSRYWEKIQTLNNDGENIIRLRVYSLAEIPELKFKKLLRDIVEKGKTGPEVKAQVLDHFEAEIKKFQDY